MSNAVCKRLSSPALAPMRRVEVMALNRLLRFARPISGKWGSEVNEVMGGIFSEHPEVSVRSGPALDAGKVLDRVNPASFFCAVRLGPEGETGIVSFDPGFTTWAVGKIRGNRKEARLAELVDVEKGMLAFLAAGSAAAFNRVIGKPVVSIDAAWQGEWPEEYRGLGRSLLSLEMAFSDCIAGKVRVIFPLRFVASCGEDAITWADVDRTIHSIPMGIRLPSLKLKPEDILSLREGDLIVCGGGFQEVLMTNSAGKPILRASLESGRLEINGRYEEEKMPENEERVIEPGSEDDSQTERIDPEELLEELTIPVSVEIGRIDVPVSDLAGLCPGCVIELAKPCHGPVKVFASGKMLAIGELVDVDGELGVRISKVPGNGKTE